MAYVIAEPCIGTKDNSCVEACPVDGIVGSVALLVALASGALLLRGHRWDAR